MDKTQLEKSMQQLQNGNIDALDNIYTETSKLVFILSYSILKSKAQAEDVVQDTYIRVVQNIHKYRKNTNAAAWISFIARNICYNEYNKAQCSVSIEIFDDNIQDKGDCFGQLEDTLYLKKAMEILNDEEREVLLLCAFYCFKHREIAQILNKPIGTVLWLYSKAKKKLREIIDNDGKQCAIDVCTEPS